MISGVTMVYNEANRIKSVLRNLAKWCDDLFVLDGGSDDGTVELAREFGARVGIWPQEGRSGEYGNDGVGGGWNEPVRRRLMVSQAKNEWVLVLDADELLDAPEDFFHGVKNPMRFPRWNLASPTKAIPGDGTGAWYPDLCPRFLHRDTVYTNSSIHCFPLMDRWSDQDAHIFHFKRIREEIPEEEAFGMLDVPSLPNGWEEQCPWNW